MAQGSLPRAACQSNCAASSALPWVMSASLKALHDGLLQEYKDRMLVIAGVGQETLFRLEFDSAFWGLWEHTRKITERKPCDEHRDGDGRVPIASAHLEDVAIRYVEGEHGGLPNIPAVAADVLAWLQDKDLKLSKTCSGALGGTLGRGKYGHSRAAARWVGDREQIQIAARV